MIVSTLNDAPRYVGLHPLFEKAFTFLRNTDFSSMEPCKIELEGTTLFASVSEYQGKKLEDAKPETHDNYLDIQYIVAGTETIGWYPRDEAKNELAPYSIEKDITFYADKATCMTTLKAGEFAIFYPEDVHQPCIADGKVKKVVVKIKVNP